VILVLGRPAANEDAAAAEHGGGPCSCKAAAAGAAAAEAVVAGNVGALPLHISEVEDAAAAAAAAPGAQLGLSIASGGCGRGAAPWLYHLPRKTLVFTRHERQGML